MTHSSQDESVVAIFDSHTDAEAAVISLQQAGLDMQRLSIVGRDFHTEEHALGFYTTGDRIKFWGGRGVLWGSLWGMLFGSAFFFIPAVGPLVVMGPLVGWIVGVLEGAAVGGATGVIAAALASIGIPDDQVVKYELDVKAGKFLVLARGPSEMITHARAVLGTSRASHLSAPVSTAERIPMVPKRVELATRESILALLSDDEVAHVTTAETATHLVVGDEFIDLSDLERGVQQYGHSTPAMGHVLPRDAVKPSTWEKVLKRIAEQNSAYALPTR